MVGVPGAPARRTKGATAEQSRLTLLFGDNQPPHHARDTRAEMKPSLDPRAAAHLPFARCASAGIVSSGVVYPLAPADS
jgi:hypothetical protein